MHKVVMHVTTDQTRLRIVILGEVGSEYCDAGCIVLDGYGNLEELTAASTQLSLAPTSCSCTPHRNLPSFLDSRKTNWTDCC